MFSLNNETLIESIIQNESSKVLIATPLTSNKFPYAQANHNAERFGNNSSRLNLPISNFVFVLSRCEALKSLYILSQSRVLGRIDGFALAWFMMNFRGWEERIKRMKGWGETKQHWGELDHSFKKGYVGYNCKEMIRLGLCRKKSTCFICGGLVQGHPFKPHPILFTNGANNKQ